MCTGGTYVMGRVNAKHKRRSAAPERVKDAEANFYRCPKQHALPNRTANGECTPLWCADTDRGSRGSTSKEVVKTREARDAVKEAVQLKGDLHIDGMLKGDDETVVLAKNTAKDSKVDEMVRIGKGAGRFAARLSALGTPTGLQGVEAEKWADSKLVEMLPLAVAEVEYQLKFGDDAQREKAAGKVLDATGRGKKEQQGNSAPTIILVGAGTGGALNYPWMKRATPAVLDAPKDPDAKE
jgi:hypothetical protein